MLPSMQAAGRSLHAPPSWQHGRMGSQNQAGLSICMA